jgi:folate-binding protein YgfZ
MLLEETLLREYEAVRHASGWLLRDEVGWIAARGEDTFTWLQGMVSQDTRLLAEGKVTRLPACVLNATGHLLSDVVLLCVSTEPPSLLIEMPRQNIKKLFTTLDRFLIREEVELEVVENLVCLSVQGPQAQAGLGAGLLEAAADHTGSGGFDWYGTPEQAAQVFDGAPIQRETAEILRVEAGIPKYGVDMDESVIALEANLGPTHISLTKGCYVGQEIIARIDSRGHTNRALTGLVVERGDLPAFGDKIFAQEEGRPRETGRITSVIPSSPALQGKPIALGYVRHEHRAPGHRLQVEGDGRSCLVSVTQLPFYSP